jgi:hypothetical protein
MSDLPSSTRNLPPSYEEAISANESKNDDNTPFFDQLLSLSKKELITKLIRMSEDQLEKLFQHMNTVNYFMSNIIEPMYILAQFSSPNLKNLKEINNVDNFNQNLAFLFNLTVAYRNIIGWGEETTKPSQYKENPSYVGRSYGYKCGELKKINEFHVMLSTVAECVHFKGIIYSKNERIIHYAATEEEQYKKKEHYTKELIYCLDRMLAFMRLYFS